MREALSSTTCSELHQVSRKFLKTTFPYSLLPGPHRAANPPPSGCSDDQLAIDILRFLKRSETVINLLCHLPFIKELDGHGCYKVLEETSCIVYLRNGEVSRRITIESCRGHTLGDMCLFPADAERPQTFMSLTERREGLWWVLDKDAGVIYPCGGAMVDREAPVRPDAEGKVHLLSCYFTWREYASTGGWTSTQETC
ncbi:hypothetical protein HBI88_163860 [Parastagonospora nodorum]|nr:hypothetical protein HBH72_241240 [Parastagonospora nodorum]KAH5786938.1 hypothetical protein HBI96_228340 [Parastagonospora nodorum]KAH5872650.1 hypothetical protein HBI92_169700 [Parastagonospora nodorum]KAH5918609.1 hypothetical protein HBI88_163860 [Parastagonospora nodorum]KAH5936150.1 hypothetical protein HBI86_169390 [Parastagonospora nodorum]